jgi:hypothetical protein
MRYYVIIKPITNKISINIFGDNPPIICINNRIFVLQKNFKKKVRDEED